MSPLVEAAADTLYGAALKDFVVERKRLATELKASEPGAAAGFGKLPRPGQAAWAVNQLFRHARQEWDALLAITARLRGGELSAAGEQRAAVAALRERAAGLLEAEGKAGGEPVLSRVATNLRAIAATGWGEVVPGRLIDDRDEPGFDALVGFPLAAASTAHPEGVGQEKDSATGDPERVGRARDSATGHPERSGGAPTTSTGASRESESGAGEGPSTPLGEDGGERAPAKAHAQQVHAAAERARAEAHEEQEAAERARAEAHAKQQREAAERARAEAHAKQQQEAAERTRAEAHAKQQREAAERAAELARLTEAVEAHEKQASAAHAEVEASAARIKALQTSLHEAERAHRALEAAHEKALTALADARERRSAAKHR